MEANKYGLILDNLSDVVWIAGLSGGPSYISPSIKSFLGVAPAEFLAMPQEKVFTRDSSKAFSQLAGFYEDVQNTLRDVKDPEKYHRGLELEFLGKSGESKVGEVRASLHHNKDGKVLGMLLLIRDITDRKRFEEKTVEMLNREKELSKFKTQVISTISHEFRTPISIIYSNLQLLKKFSYKIEEGIQKDAFELTTIAIQSLSKTLDNLTLLNQSNKGVLSYNPVEFDLLEECKRIASEISSINHNNGRIVSRFNFPPGLVVMDKALLNHVLSNLLVNALKFSSDETKVEFSLEDIDGKRARFIIKDLGIGIAEEELEHIFESFYRGANARGTKGTGLGMSIVKRCIELQNGKIDVKSELGKGTEVNVILPYERQQ